MLYLIGGDKDQAHRGAEAAKTFNGDPCGLCKDTAWTVKRKNWK
jgi:hypothetical protein